MGSRSHQLAKLGIYVEVTEMTTDQLRLHSIQHRQHQVRLKIPDGRGIFFLIHRHTISAHGILKELYDGQRDGLQYIIVSEEYEPIVMRALSAEGKGRAGKLKVRKVHYMTTESYTVEGVREDKRFMDVLALPEASLWESDLIYTITTLRPPRQISNPSRLLSFFDRRRGFCA